MGENGEGLPQLAMVHGSGDIAPPTADRFLVDFWIFIDISNH
jgi:hypothetical protein